MSAPVDNEEARLTVWKALAHATQAVDAIAEVNALGPFALDAAALDDIGAARFRLFGAREKLQAQYDGLVKGAR